MFIIELFELINVNNYFQGQKVYNASQCKSENINRVMMVYADDYKEVGDVPLGNIVAVTGLKVG